MSILVASRERSTSTTKTFTYNSASQLTNTGYVYDGLGRNTSIPAAHSANSVGVIGLSYKVTDQVASITQNGVSTVYGFDAVGRRVTETTGGSVLTKHYTASSDNPAWSSNNAGVTDIYLSSLGAGLNGTVHVDNGVKTVSLDVNDLRGNTVTRINLDTATTDSWVSFDEYGNRDTASTGKLVTYDAYGQYERATTSQGLILMGARVYNPVTNQFTSPDPITGGNETPYTYPNDPINKTDFDGNWGWGDTLDLALTVASFLPIPGLQQIAWIAKAYKAVSVTVRAISLVAKVSKASKIAGNSTLAVKETEKVINLAGKIWTRRFTKSPYKPGGHRIISRKPSFRQYRSPVLKESGPLKGKLAANFEQHHIGGNNWHANVHVEMIEATLGRP